MSTHHLIKRALAGGLVITAVGFPSAAQAMFIGGGGVPSVPAPGGPAAPEPVATSHSAFQWGDAGIGAAGATVLLSAGALGTGVARRRRIQRTIVG